MITKIKHKTIKWTKNYFDVECVMELEEFRVHVFLHGYHIYKDIWYAVVGEILVCEREPKG